MPDFWTENGQTILLVLTVVTALVSIPFIVVGIHFDRGPLIVVGVLFLLVSILIGLKRFCGLQLLPSQFVYPYTQI